MAHVTEKPGVSSGFSSGGSQNPRAAVGSSRLPPPVLLSSKSPPFPGQLLTSAGQCGQKHLSIQFGQLTGPFSE